MRRLRNITILIALLTGALVFARHSAALLAWAETKATSANRLTSLRVVSPQNGEQFRQSAVTVQYAPLQIASAPVSPEFELLLDGQDPVRTGSKSYTFTGLTPGTHDLIVQVLDANHTPIPSTRSELSFVILPANFAEPTAQKAGDQSPVASNNMAMLPDARSSLPLLSVIGFGILVGGVISALRTRPAANR